MPCYDFEATSARTKVVSAWNERLESNKGFSMLKRNAISREKIREPDQHQRKRNFPSTECYAK
jgi:hypothetical protein